MCYLTWWRPAAFLAALLTCFSLLAPGQASAVTHDSDEWNALLQRLDRYERELEAVRQNMSDPEHAAYCNGGYQNIDRRVQALEANWGGDGKDTGGMKAVEIQKKPSHNIRGRIFADHIVWDNDPVLARRQTETGFDTARMGMYGNVYENVQYKIEIEFEGTEVDYKDVYLQYDALPILGHFRVGHFKEPFSLQEQTSSRFVTFMERDIANGAFVPARNFGFMFYDYWRGNENLSWFGGVFRGDFDDSPSARGTEVQSVGDWSFTGRVGWLPYYDEPSGGRYLVHLGGGASYRTTGRGRVDGDPQEIRFRSGRSLGSQVNYLTAIVDNDRNWGLAGLEAAMVWGSFSIQSEVYLVDTGANDYSGGYALVSYFLTGEHRGYKRSSKAFDRVKPIEPAFWIRDCDGCGCYGKGAWELKAMWEYVDLKAGDNPADERGYQDNFRAGVNWYLNPYSRVMFDYVFATVDYENGVTGETQGLGMRFQVDW